MVVDLLLLAEFCWCTVIFGTRGLQRALLYSGGVLASGFVSVRLSGWFTQIFVPPNTPAFEWLEQQVATLGRPVSALAIFIPPEPASMWGVAYSQWVAYHVLRAMIFVAITMAIFVVFVIVADLSDALWDEAAEINARPICWLPAVAASLCSLYTVALTGELLANLAWLKTFSPFTGAVANSAVIHLIGQMTVFIQTHINVL